MIHYPISRSCDTSIQGVAQMKPMVSVIVPVYNAEQTLRRCVSSILDQQYTDLELLW